jgi:glutathione S-transferase
MIGNRLLLHAAFLTAAPIIVAWFGLSVPAAVLLVLLLLLWRWLVVLSGYVVPANTPPLILSTIAASHFVEKVRWSMDRLGVDYVERPAGGAMGAFFLGRTVPQLKARTGAVQSVIGNSAEILRYLWGRYEVDDPARAAFLRPTQERIDFESRLDQYGASLQVWVYYHVLDDRALTLRAWGAEDPATPLWQRYLLKVLFPVLRALIRRSFRITEANHQKSVSRIEALLEETNGWLADDRPSLLNDGELNYTDFAFAAMTGLWLMCPQYGGGRAAAVRIELQQAPPAMRADVERWSEKFPRAVGFVERLYREERNVK